MRNVTAWRTESRPHCRLERRVPVLGAVASRWALIGLALATPVLALDAPIDQLGESLFDSYCSACHQYDDQGMGEAPPLDGAPWVTGPADRLVRIVLHGIKGRIEVRGKLYDREMPGFGRMLSDRQVAALVTYTRSRFGAKRPAVKPSEVARIRQEHAGRTEYWPADELLRLR